MQKIFTKLTAKKTNFGLYCSILGALIVTISLNSCKKTNTTIVPTYTAVELSNASGVGSYFLRPTNAPFLVPVGITTASSSDQVINFSVTSKTAVVGVQYTAPPTSVTIKAGKYTDTLRIAGIFTGYPTGRKDTMTVTMQSSFPAVNNVTVYQFVTQAYCDVVAANLTGNYTTTVDYYPAVGSGASASKYTASISNWVATSSTTATVTLQNVGKSPDTGFGPFQASDPAATGITATINWSNPSSFTITIASQPYMASLYTYGAATISGSGTWSSCDQKWTLGYSVKVGAGTFTSQWTVLTR